jgi:hypothetical protein
MSEGDDNSQRFLSRIRQELDRLPLTEAEKENAVPELLRAANFLDTRGGRTAPGGLDQDSPLFNFAPKITAVVTHFQNRGLTFQDYLAAAIKQPQLFYQSPATIASNIEGVVTHFAAHGLTTAEYLAAAVQAPSLFASSPATIASNIEGVVTQFAAHGLTTAEYLAAALRAPPLFVHSPAIIAANVGGVVERCADNGLTTPGYIRAALRQPQLFYQAPDTIAGKVEAVVARFATDGLTTRAYLRAAVKQPQLFYQSPDTIAGNIEGVVVRFAADGLTTPAYLRAALRQPQLFYQSPDTIIRHIEAVLSFADRGIFTPPARRRNSAQRTGPSENRSHAAVIEFLLTHPALMSLADDNYGLREIHHRLTNGPTDSALLLRPRYAVEEELLHRLGHNDARQAVPSDGFIAGAAPPTEEQARQFVLRALIHAGFIRSASLER